MMAQTPQSFKYQTVARNNAGDVLASQNITFRMTLLQGDLPGTVIYTETHATATNAFGLATLEIGRGTPVTGSFATINWSITPIFLRTEIDPAGGSSFVEMGTSELLSVPYALEAKHARTLTLEDENGNEFEITVDPLGNLIASPILPPWQCGSPFTDTRDSKTYTTVPIGTQCWMAENLNIGTRIDGSSNQANNATIEKYCYENSEAQCDVYGGLYQWNEMMNYTTTPGVQGICPDGWHLPTDAEWTALTTYLGGESVAGGKMKETGTTHWNSPNTGATNSSGFTGLPGGYRNIGGTFGGLGSDGYFWSSSEYSTTNAWARGLSYSSAFVYRYIGLNKSYGFSVRCLRDL